MDVNESIVAAWLEIQGFLVRKRVLVDLSKKEDWSSAGDVDIVGWRPTQPARVAVMVTAWMTQNVTPSDMTTGQLYGTLNNFVSDESDRAIRHVLGDLDDNDYQRWWVVGRLGNRSRDEVKDRALHDYGIVRVFEFKEIMAKMVLFVKYEHKWLPHESESLQTLRALEWCGFLN